LTHGSGAAFAMMEAWDMRMGGTGDATFVRRLFIVFAVGALALLLWYLADVLLLVFAAVLVALLLRSIAEPIDRRTGIGDNAALAIAALLVTLVIGIAVYLFGSEIRNQTIKLAETLPEAWELFTRRVFSGDLVEDLMERAEDAAPAAGQVLTNVLIGPVRWWPGWLRPS
jgi:predicted PurR-regulated permease PerM